MPRRREIPKRELAADPLYNSTLVSKFINTVMSDGKRSTAEIAENKRGARIGCLLQGSNQGVQVEK